MNQDHSTFAFPMKATASLTCDGVPYKKGDVFDAKTQESRDYFRDGARVAKDEVVKAAVEAPVAEDPKDEQGVAPDDAAQETATENVTDAEPATARPTSPFHRKRR